MIKRLLVFLLMLTAGFALRADDQIRSAQQTLKEQGFYFGEIDGQPGPETSAAIRRYQIRNGMKVTGTLNPETISALTQGNIEPEPSRDGADVRAPSGVSESDREFLNKRPMPPGAVPPPSAIVPPGFDEYAQLFAKTPYEDAPPEVQRSTLQRAQLKLGRFGFYRGDSDGMPGPETTRAITAYQIRRHIDETGRLDMRTLSELELLPAVKHLPKPVSIPEEPVPGRRIYRGIWVR